MKTINDLESKIWYRFLKVVYILIFVFLQFFLIFLNFNNINNLDNIKEFNDKSLIEEIQELKKIENLIKNGFTQEDAFKKVYEEKNQNMLTINKIDKNDNFLLSVIFQILLYLFSYLIFFKILNKLFYYIILGKINF